MDEYRQTRLWRTSLGKEADGGGHKEARDRLRHAYSDLRGKARAVLAGEIAW